MSSEEFFDVWPISNVDHEKPISFEQFWMLAQDIQLLPYKQHPILKVENQNINKVKNIRK
ncbi:hypothetical protein IFO68_09170 [Photobacterium sp. CAU 1568]|uniref:Uncharacterized protein n=1 Tax=Photobacterium arenosum TaxID=2774143 RepID=A0ABR9BJW5_9GAMM|nr:hypothetical protein [Photobacterium arenosum]MBD8512860.1 hypothetical protein [Photobacterium arenosum]